MKSNSSNNNKRNRGRNNRGRNTPRQLAARNSLRTELVYADTWHYASSGAYSNHVTFRGNSAFDPYFSVGGHQPLAYDQLAALYKKYNVHGSRIEVSILNRVDSSSTYPQRTLTACCYPSVQSVPTSTVLSTVREQPYCKTVFTGPSISSRAIQNFSMEYRTTAEVFGSSSTDQDFKAEVTTNPAKEWFWIIFVTTNVPLEPIDVTVQVKVYYDITFFARKTLTGS